MTRSMYQYLSAPIEMLKSGTSPEVLDSQLRVVSQALQDDPQTEMLAERVYALRFVEDTQSDKVWFEMTNIIKTLQRQVAA